WEKILKRTKEWEKNILEDEVIKGHIDNSKVKNIIFVLVATPVEEVGRDHDFDWAVIEPSSFRSFIQLAGRVLRHREREVIEPNIAIMKYNYRALKTEGKKIAFKWPGYQNDKNDLTTYDLNKLVNTTELAEKLDATNRIKKTKSSELADLEHKVIHQLLTNYESKGPESMQGWLESDWWLTALPQQYVRFRGNKSKDLTVFLTIENAFLEKDVKGNAVEVGKDNITHVSLSESELQNLWFKRNYARLITQQAEQLKLDLENTALIYGEINLPTYGEPLTTQKFFYNEQLGLTKE
ncbi:MAG: type I-F CRISPR-associated helicase Cas3, partial [Thiomicrorhabdus sp.]|nr:type I-F CRISPR-associated helicase Cas3 [Thiomicrorhabdus sp.]